MGTSKSFMVLQSVISEPYSTCPADRLRSKYPRTMRRGSYYAAATHRSKFNVGAAILLHFSCMATYTLRYRGERCRASTASGKQQTSDLTGRDLRRGPRPDKSIAPFRESFAPFRTSTLHEIRAGTNASNPLTIFPSAVCGCRTAQANMRFGGNANRDCQYA